jgi:GTP-binding protein
VSNESQLDTLRAVKTSTVTAVVMDHSRMSKEDDLQQVTQVIEEGRGVVLVFNKWDLILDSRERRRAQAEVDSQVRRYLGNLGNAEVVHMSALEGAGVSEVMPAVLRVHERLARSIATHRLNQWLKEIVSVQQPPRVRGVKLKIRFIIQAPRAPPTFVLFLNTVDSILPGSYIQYLANSLRRDFDLHSVPVRIVQRNKRPTGASDAPGRRVTHR